MSLAHVHYVRIGQPNCTTGIHVVRVRQPALTACTSDKKYRFGVPFKVLTQQFELYTQSPLECADLHIIPNKLQIFILAGGCYRVMVENIQHNNRVH